MCIFASDCLDALMECVGECRCECVRVLVCVLVRVCQWVVLVCVSASVRAGVGWYMSMGRFVCVRVCQRVVWCACEC